MGVSWLLSISLHYVTGTHWECIVNGIFVSIMSWVLIGSVLSMVYFYLLSTLWEYLDHCLFLSIISWVLIGSVLTTIVYTSPLCHGYSFGVSLPLSICLHYVMDTHWECLDILFICIHYVMNTYLECLDNCLFVLILSWVLIWNALTLVYLSSLWHGYSLGELWKLGICLHNFMGTHFECLDTCLIVFILSWVPIGSVLTIFYVSLLCHGYSLGCLDGCLFSPSCHGYSLGCLDSCLFVSMVSCVLIGSV